MSPGTRHEVLLLIEEELEEIGALLNQGPGFETLLECLVSLRSAREALES